MTTTDGAPDALPISWGRRITQLAEAHPDQAAIVFVTREGRERVDSWAELETASNRFARVLAAHGLGPGGRIAVGLPNCPEHYAVSIAAWKVGALVLPLRRQTPAPERDAILEVFEPTVVVADWEEVPWPTLTLGRLLAEGEAVADGPLPDVTPHPGKSIGSGGSTGRPKVIIDPAPWARVPGAPFVPIDIGFGSRQVHLVAGPLYHNSPFTISHLGQFEDHTLVLMERFDAELAMRLIERHRVAFFFMTPTMMQRIVRLEDPGRFDVSSLEGMYHAGAPCPEWVKRAWLDIFPPETSFEAFGATEAVGMTAIRGDEWLEHPGSVGRPYGCDLEILNADGIEVPFGEVGEIFMRPHTTDATYEYLGAARARTTDDGFASVGDLGWVDEDGYLFAADRRVDLILTGGANVYPAEVEAALSDHPAVHDVAVIGVPDDEWGRRVHAIVESVSGRGARVEELDAHCRERLMSYKVPKSYEFVDELPRLPSGKLRRSAMVEARSAGWTAAMQPAKTRG